MKYVLHVDEGEVITDKIDHTMVVVPPRKAVRIANDFIAQIFMEHKQAIHGLVYVDEVDEGDGGYKLDVAGAIARATEALDIAERSCITEYVETQRQDRMRMNFPALPPQGRTAKVISKRGIDLLGMGIRPVGYEVDRQLASSGNEALKTEIDDLRKRLAEALELMNVLAEEKRSA